MKPAFDRFDILAAYSLYSVLFAGDAYTAALQVRLTNLPGCRLPYRPSRTEESPEGLSENAQEIYMELVRAHHGAEAAEEVRCEIRPEAGDATVKLVTSDEDPTRISADVFYKHAERWADAVGGIEGGSWEGTGDPGFVYDTLTWRPGLIADLKKDGFTLDLSEYCEPSEAEIATARHAFVCSECEYDYRKAEQHLTGAE